MFRCIREWRERRRLRRRGLFEYFDGRQARFADPYALFRALVSNPAINLEEIGPAAEKGSEPETTQLAEFIAGVFGLRRFDSATRQGLTDAELFEILDRFYSWLEALKKNGFPGVISSPAMASTPSPASPAPPVSTPLETFSD